MKKFHYHPAFNAREFGPAEKRADAYWKKRIAEMGEARSDDEKAKKVH